MAQEQQKVEGECRLVAIAIDGSDFAKYAFQCEYAFYNFDAYQLFHLLCSFEQSTPYVLDICLLPSNF